MMLTAMLAGCLLATDLPPQARGAESASLARQLLPDMQVHRTSRYLVLSDSDRQTIRSAENTLADARRQYDRWCSAIRAARPRPEERLVCIIFHDQSRFAEFAALTEDGGIQTDAISGFFSPRFDWVVFFHPEDADDIRAAHERLDAFEQEIDDAASEGAPPEALDEARSTLANARDEIDLELERRRTAVTIHEAIHQLVHVGSAFPGRAHWPDWLHEGVAVAFETDNRRRPFGPDRAWAGRRATIDAAMDRGEIMSLEDLLTSGPIDHSHRDHTGLLYAQAGALIEWLHRKHRRNLAAFLSSVGVPDEHGRIPDIRAVFTDTIGDPDRISRAWLRDLQP